MTDPTNFRRERIEKLLHELRYEVERGFMNGEIDETIDFNFIFPVSRALKGGVVLCRFSTRPTHHTIFRGAPVHLRLVASND